MKKQVISLITALCIFIGLCGCDSISNRPASLGDSVEIPDDGVISSAMLDEMRQNHLVVKFCGESGGLAYAWTIFGSDIKEEKALTLGIEITEATDSKIAFQFLSKENFGFSPALSITLNSKWNSDGGTVYRIAGNGVEKAGKAILTVKDACILNFTPPAQTGTFEIRADGTQEKTSQTETALPDVSNQTSAAETSASSETISRSETDAPALPDGTVKPAEPGSVPEETQPQKNHTCILSIACTSILNHLEDLEPDKLDVLPKDGILFAPREVEFQEGESVYDLLQRVCKENGIPLEASFTPMYNSTYVEGIGNLYEFDCGSGSGWMYCVDGWYPNYGCSLYALKDGQTVEWRYTCDLGKDIGGANALVE